MLDGLIGNTDRHHENRAFLRWYDEKKQTHYIIAPTFDHASSLGRELLDEKREMILKENRIEHYISKGKGAIYADKDDKKGLNPLKLVKLAKNQYPELFGVWFEKVNQLESEEFDEIIQNIPADFISETEKTFALAMLKNNLNTLKEMAI